MQQVRDIVKTPSEALQAMVTGLKNQSEREDFEIDFGTFGWYKSKICYGCAATCTIQEIFQFNFTNSLINGIGNRAKALNVIDWIELSDFEDSINSARMGFMIYLFRFYNIEPLSVPKEILNPDFDLWDDNWENEIPKIEAYIEELKKLNL